MAPLDHALMARRGAREGPWPQVQAGRALASPRQCPQCRQGGRGEGPLCPRAGPQRCEDTGNTSRPSWSLNICDFDTCEVPSGDGQRVSWSHVP